MLKDFFPPENTGIISGAGIKKFSDIEKHLKHKEYFGLKADSNEICEIKENETEKFGNLVFLDLSKNKISSLSFISRFKRLTAFLGNSNYIENVNFIDKCPSLKCINLSCNKISQIELEVPMKNLLFCDFSENLIKNIGFGNFFPSLVTLSLDSNHITDIAGIKTFPKLKEIHISRNHVTNFAPFPQNSITFIDISFNNITSMKCFSYFSNLVSLNLSGNPITDKGLFTEETLQKLTSLNLRYTNITTPSMINCIAPKLVNVDLRQTKISDERELIRFISGATYLTSIDVRCTPISHEFDCNANSFDSYKSIDEFDKLFPDNSSERKEFRKRLINAAVSPLEFLNGIRISTEELSSMQYSDENVQKRKNKVGKDEKIKKMKIAELEKKNVDLRNEIVEMMMKNDEYTTSTIERSNENKEEEYCSKEPTSYYYNEPTIKDGVYNYSIGRKITEYSSPSDISNDYYTEESREKESYSPSEDSDDYYTEEEICYTIKEKINQIGDLTEREEGNYSESPEITSLKQSGTRFYSKEREEGNYSESPEIKSLKQSGTSFYSTKARGKEDTLFSSEESGEEIENYESEPEESEDDIKDYYYSDENYELNKKKAIDLEKWKQKPNQSRESKNEKEYSDYSKHKKGQQKEKFSQEKSEKSQRSQKESKDKSQKSKEETEKGKSSRKMFADENEFEKRRNYLMECLNSQNSNETLSELEKYNTEISTIRDNIKNSYNKDKKAVKMQLAELEKILEDNNKIIKQILALKMNEKQNHHHEHHHCHHSTKSIPTKDHKHHSEYKSSRKLTDNEIKERTNVKKQKKHQSKDYRSQKCICFPEETKEKEDLTKIKVKRYGYKKGVRFHPSLDRKERSKEEPLVLNKIDEIGGWKYYDKPRFENWESISTLCSEKTIPEIQVEAKNVKPSYPFTSQAQRNVPWDKEKQIIPEVRKNKEQKAPEKLTFEKCEYVLLDNARVDTTSRIGKASYPIEKVEFNSKEFEYLKFWMSCIKSKEVLFNEVLKAHNTPKFNAMFRSAKNMPVLVLKKVEDSTVALSVRVEDNSVFTRDRITRGDYILCAADLGKVAVNKHRECFPSSELMAKIKKHGFDSIVYRNKSSEYICIADGSKVVPLYSFSII